ncbi:unnamed protein product [Lathyrus sativus]|nr:unnamed protein product [Lathyrus sativus]
MPHKKSTKRSLTSEMDRNVRQMMKLIEDNGDSFAQKAEMYYQKRPELISLVEEFYRGYRSLVERYEPAAGDLWKNIPSDLQSQASGVSDNSSEPPPASPRKTGRRISITRAPGFDFFLGSGGNNNGYDSSCQKDGDAFSNMSDSDDEYDGASSINSYSGFFGNASDNGMTKRVIELEIELRAVQDKILVYEQQEQGHSEDGVKINGYEQELKNVNENMRLSQEKIHKLEIEVEKYNKSMDSLAYSDNDTCSRLGQGRSELDLCAIGTNELSSSTKEDLNTKRDIKFFEDELSLAKEKVENFEVQTASLKIETSKSNERHEQLQDQLNLAHKETDKWKTMFNSEKRDNIELQERVSRLKTSLVEREHEMIELQERVSGLKTSLVEKEHEIKDLKGILSESKQKNLFEKSKLKTKVCKLLEQHNHMEERLRDEIEMLKREIHERNDNIVDLNVRLGGLILERDNLNEEVGLLKEEMNSRGKEIEKANRHVVELESRAKELDDEIERHKIEILEGAEEKREVIRQLCFSLEHYRNGYNVFRKAFIGHNRFPLLTS